MAQLDLAHSQTPIVAFRPQQDVSAPALPETLIALLNRMRFHAIRCRASAHLDLFKACSLLDPHANGAEIETLRTLVRVMGQALDREPVFFQPGSAEISFDERWLLALITAAHTKDDNSFQFLMVRRVAHHKRRIFSLLIKSLAENTSLAGSST